MLRYTQGDLFASGAQLLVNPVNCVGVMGKGLALAFKERFPSNFVRYKQVCDAKELEPGKILFVEIDGEDPRWIANLPTKRHWRQKSRLEDVRAGLSALAEEIRTRQISSVAIPALGAGLGGLDWADVKAVIADELGELSGVEITVFEPR